MQALRTMAVLIGHQEEIYLQKVDFIDKNNIHSLKSLTMKQGGRGRNKSFESHC